MRKSIRSLKYPVVRFLLSFYSILYFLFYDICNFDCSLMIRFFSPTSFFGERLKKVWFVETVRIVADLEKDWSDHALWWPEKRKWLHHTRSTLDQMGVTADSQLEFTPMHKETRLVMTFNLLVRTRTSLVMTRSWLFVIRIWLVMTMVTKPGGNEICVTKFTR